MAAWQRILALLNWKQPALPPPTPLQPPPVSPLPQTHEPMDFPIGSLRSKMSRTAKLSRSRPSQRGWLWAAPPGWPVLISAFRIIPSW